MIHSQIVERNFQRLNIDDPIKKRIRVPKDVMRYVLHAMRHDTRKRDDRPTQMMIISQLIQIGYMRMMNEYPNATEWSHNGQAFKFEIIEHSPKITAKVIDIAQNLNTQMQTVKDDVNIERFDSDDDAIERLEDMYIWLMRLAVASLDCNFAFVDLSGLDHC